MKLLSSLCLILLASTVLAQKVAVTSVGFSDSPNLPPSISSISSTFNSSAAFHLENSYGLKVLTADYYGPITVNVTGCDTAGINAQVQRALDLSHYDILIYAMAYRSSCGWSSLRAVSNGSAPRIYLNGILSTQVLSHEVGHAFGLYHAGALDCGSLAIGASCAFIEYGDRFDVMAKSLYHMNAYQKMRLGVLKPFLVSISGQYTLFPIELNQSAIKVLKTGETYYYIEYRQPVGYDSGLGTNAGVLIHQGTEFQDSFNLFFSYLLDATPETSSWLDSALRPGKSFYDADNRIKITTISADAIQAVVDVQLDAEAPPTPSPSPTPEPTPTPAPTPCRGGWKKCG